MTAQSAGRLALVDTPRLIELPTVREPRGALTALELETGLPFRPQRLYYLTDVPPGASRGGHAHRKLQQVLVAVAGRFEVTLWRGADEQRLVLQRPDQGLYLPAMCWREVSLFSEGAVCLVLASAPYDEGDYIRERERFLQELQPDPD